MTPRTTIVNYLVVVAITFAVSFSAHAGGVGLIRLIGIQPGSRVYVDGQPADVTQGVIQLAEGEHFLQVEEYRSLLQLNLPPHPQQQHHKAWPVGVVVFRSCVSVKSGQDQKLPVRFAPVLTTNAAYAEQLALIGSPGPVGPPGTPAGLALRLEPQAAQTLFKQSLSALLAELETLAQEVELRHYDYRETSSPPDVLWFNPSKQPADLLPFMDEPGPPGLSGLHGLPGDVRRIKDVDGVLVLDKLSKRMGLEELRQALTELKQRSSFLKPPAVLANKLEPITIHTPGFKTLLDNEYKRLARQDKPKIAFTNNPSRRVPQGLRGNRGPDGQIPTGAADIIFAAPEFSEIAQALQNDPALQTQLQALRNRLHTLSQSTQLLETQAAATAHCD